MSEQTNSAISLVRLEEETRRFWRRDQAPLLWRTHRQSGPTAHLYQEPLQVVGQPWADQVRLLATADLLARFRAMRGETVQYLTGWVTHGLAVEYAVEQSLGPDTADYGLEGFNAICRQTALEGADQCQVLAEWLGVWLQEGDVFDTMSPAAIGACWAALHRLWEAGRLKQEQRVVPTCPRCATPLSTSEAGQRRVGAKGLSAWLRLPWDDEPETYFLTWTAMPWTLLGMTALAAHPEASYVLVELEGEQGQPDSRLVLAEALLGRAPVKPARILRRLSGRSLRGARYRPPFTFLPLPQGAGRVVLSKEVPLNEGAGLMPIVPAFDALSLTLAQENDLPIPDLLDDNGKFGEGARPWRGLTPLDSEPFLVEDLESRGLLVRQEPGPSVRRLCPYCETPLLPQARQTWLVDTEAGPWILGRDRAWATPLPIWQCDRCHTQICLAGLDELAQRTGQPTEMLDLHRPAVDGLVFPCHACRGTMRRVPAVLDAAFEAAALPWALGPQGMGAESASTSQRALAIGLGQEGGGWLADLATAATLLRGPTPWGRSLKVPLGQSDLMLDIDSRTPADALRWAVYTETSPLQAEREFLQPLWELAVTSTQGPLSARGRDAESAGDESLLDRWIAARLRQTTQEITRALEALDLGRAARALNGFVQHVTAWYAPLRPEGVARVLEPLSRLLAPFAPHLAEAIRRHTGDRTSVHLADWPIPERADDDASLLRQMERALCLARLARSARQRAGIPADRMLDRARIAGLSDEVGADATQTLWSRLLGVRQVERYGDGMAQVAWRLRLAPDWVTGRGVPLNAIDASLAALAPQARARLVADLWEGRSIGLEVDGQLVTLLPDEVEISVDAEPGWVAAAQDGCLVALEIPWIAPDTNSTQARR